MPLPFRNPISSSAEGAENEEWEPPDYAQPVETSKASEAWKPPSYATPVSAKKEEKKGALSRFVEAVKPPKSQRLPGTGAPAIDLSSVKEAKTDEEIRAAARDVESERAKKPEQKQGFFSDVMRNIREQPAATLKGFAQGAKEGVKSLFKYNPEQMKSMLESAANPQTIGDFLSLMVPTDLPAMKGARVTEGLPPLGMRSREIPYRMEPSTPLPKATKVAEEIPVKQKVADFIKKNPDAKMEDVEKFVQSVAPTEAPPKTAEIPKEAPKAEKSFINPFEKKPEETLPPETRPLVKKFGRVMSQDEASPIHRATDYTAEPERIRVPANKVVATQEGFQEPIIEKYRQEPGTELPTASKMGDEYILSEGHHRALAQMAEGSNEIELNAYPVNEELARNPQPQLSWLERMKPAVAGREESVIKPAEGWKPPEYAKPVEKIVTGGSSESSASAEALSRQKSMKSKGQQYVVYDRAGNERPLIGPDAVDYVPRPGETYGIRTSRGFRTLEDKGGKIPDRGSIFGRLSSERGSMFVGEGMPAPSEGPRGETARTLLRNTQSKVGPPIKGTLPESLEEFNTYIKENKGNSDYANIALPHEIQRTIDTLRDRASWGLKNLLHDNVPWQRAELEQTANYLNQLADKLEKSKDAKTLYAIRDEILQDINKRPPSSGIVQMHGGLGGISPPMEPSVFSGKPESRALNKLFNALEETRGKIGEQAAINRQERARRFAAFGEVQEEGAAGAAKSLSRLKGEFEKVQPGAGLGLDQNETDSLFTAVKRARITEAEKARGYTALFKLMNGESTPVRSELKILDDVFGNGFADKITEMHGGIGAIGLKLTKTAATMKSMQNALSLAAPLRHGVGLIARREFYPAFADMFRFFGNKEYYNSAMKAIQEGPNYLLGRDAGLFLSSPGSLQGAEEEFLNSYAGSIPGVRNVVGASQRAYTGFLNKLRSDVFDSMVKQAESLGNKTSLGGEATNTTRAISRFINNATGRGSLGSLNKMTNELNLLFWSPRMISSRVTMLTNPKLYLDLPKGMRREGLKSLLGIAALGTIIDTAAAYGGAKVSTNILSTDFGKSRFGTKLIDPWGGFQQYVVAAARFLAGKTDSPRPESRMDIGERFLANKLSPAASLAHNILTAKKFEGGGAFKTQYGQETSVQKEIAKQFEPIFLQDLQELVTSEPEWSDNIGLTAAMGAASLTGMAQSYPERKTGKLGFRKMQLR